MPLAEKLLPDLVRALRGRESEMVRLLKRFVCVESPTDSKTGVDRLRRVLASEWRKRGARVEFLRRRDCGNHLRIVWAGRHAPRGGQLLVLGHMDTVYGLGTLRRMPFRVSQGRAFGPGTFDMKAGLVIALFAVDALARAHALPRRRIAFLWTSDEETGSATSRAVIEREARRSSAVLVLEPASGPAGALKTERKGTGTAELIVGGRAAHAGIDPRAGVNAVQEAALQIARLARWNNRRGSTVLPTIVAGGTRSNVIPDAARVILDLRASSVADQRAVERALRALRPILPGAKLELRGGFSRPPLPRSASAALFAHARALARRKWVFRCSRPRPAAGSDGNFTAALGVPSLVGLRAVGEAAHRAIELGLVRELARRAALLAGLLATL